MIVRCWKGVTSRENADRYRDFLVNKLFPVFQSLNGFNRVEIMKREIESGCEFRVLTYWDSMKDIAQFAPEDPSIATVPDEARALLSSFDKTVSHY